MIPNNLELEREIEMRRIELERRLERDRIIAAAPRRERGNRRISVIGLIGLLLVGRRRRQWLREVRRVTALALEERW